MKNYLKNFFGGVLIVMIPLVIISVIGYMFYDISQDMKRMSYPIGKEIVVGKDTLIVVRHEFFKSSYQMNNGISVSSNLVWEQLEEEK
jgi:hypothetical protein